LRFIVGKVADGDDGGDDDDDGWRWSEFVWTEFFAVSRTQEVFFTRGRSQMMLTMFLFRVIIAGD